MLTYPYLHITIKPETAPPTLATLQQTDHPNLNPFWQPVGSEQPDSSLTKCNLSLQLPPFGGTEGGLSFKQHMSNLTEYMSNFTECTSSLTEHMSNLTECTSSLTEYMSNLTEYTSSLTEYMSNLTESMSSFKQPVRSLEESISSISDPTKNQKLTTTD